MKSLESLQLDEARLTFAALKQLKQLPALKKLKLGGIDIPKEEIDRLRQELPQVKIEWTEPNEAYQRRIRALFGGRWTMGRPPVPGAKGFYGAILDGPGTVVGVQGVVGPTADLNPELLATLLLPCFLRLLLVRLEDAKPAAPGLGVQSGDGLAQGQGLVFIESDTLGDHGCSQSHDWRSFDQFG